MNFENACRKHNLESIGEDRIILMCKECRTIWSPNLLSGGRLPIKWWLCPNGCNNKIWKNLV